MKIYAYKNNNNVFKLSKNQLYINKFHDDQVDAVEKYLKKHLKSYKLAAVGQGDFLYALEVSFDDAADTAYFQLLGINGFEV
jgi:hypothetical protein